MSDPDAPESQVVDQHLERRLQQAQIDRVVAEREQLRKGTRDRKARSDAETKHEEERTQAEIANEGRVTDARIANDDKLAAAQASDLRKQSDAERADRRLGREAKTARSKAKIARRKRMNDAEASVIEAEAKGIETRDRTTRTERFFWMVVIAFGLIASVVLALITAEATVLEYRVSPLAGLAVSAGGGFQLRLINRDQGESEAERP